ncbi:MAG: B12-binding domain-containing radical SAM protein [Theionarchaea archaeon]|nr:B12-binding domain-containing radical SAM protein [Theionarchaea archaeon]
MSEIGLIHGWFNTGNHIPLGLLYLSSILEEHGFHVDVKDYALNNSRTESVVEDFVQFCGGYPVAGISTVNFFLPYVVLACQQLKKENPECTIVLGGPGPSGVAVELVSAFPWIDAVVVGEGEKTFLQVAEYREREKDFSDINGLVFRYKEKVVVNPARNRILTLDDLPFPAYDKVNFSDYWKTYKEGDVFPVLIATSRGCPFSCTFCDVSAMWGRKNCARSLENVVEETALLKERYGQDKFQIIDDTFVLNEKRVKEFCQKIKDMNVQWSCFGRINLMSEELMEAMHSAGCIRIFYGLESGSDKILRLIRKDISSKQAEKVAVSSTQYFHVVASFIWGYPYESTVDFLKTWKLINTLSTQGIEILLNLLQPLPNSAIYTAYKDRLWFSLNVLKKYFQLPFVDDNAINLVKQHPYIFPSFYHYRSRYLESNLRIVESQNKPE